MEHEGWAGVEWKPVGVVEWWSWVVVKQGAWIGMNTHVHVLRWQKALQWHPVWFFCSEMLCSWLVISRWCSDLSVMRFVYSSGTLMISFSGWFPLSFCLLLWVYFTKHCRESGAIFPTYFSQSGKHHQMLQSQICLCRSKLDDLCGIYVQPSSECVWFGTIEHTCKTTKDQAD